MPPEIDYERCIACGACVDVCAEDVFFGTGGLAGGMREKTRNDLP